MQYIHCSELCERLRELSHLKSTLALLSWDEQVKMPKKGASLRGETMSYLAGLLHERFLAIDDDGCLTKAKAQLDAGNLPDREAAIVREVWLEYAREQKLPTAFVKELTQVTSEAHHIWAEARETNNFALFLPQLKRMIELKRQEANYVGYQESAYDALIDTFEPGVKASEIAPIFAELKRFLIAFLKQLQDAGQPIDRTILDGSYPIDTQIKFNEHIAKQIGYDFSCGRIDASTHPFTQTLHPEDVRITTRYNEKDLLYAILTTTHEVGHALYEQGLPCECYGTPLAEAISLGIHESQSKLWETEISLGKPFWDHFYPKLQETFPKPFENIELAEFLKAINCVTPSLIRTEADEVTYNLHIILRFEIEQGLIEGTIEPEDLPALWNAKMKEYLGIDVPSDALGVLQDVHWSSGYFGYFPTYTLGTLYAAQLYSKMQQDLPNMDAEMASGDFSSIKTWLGSHVHAHGRYYSAAKLIEHVTGEPLSAQYFVDYIRTKYQSLYNLKETS